ncbi:MAG: hypothetical protein ACLGIO_14820 [Acidimicrobiia bacterium]
MKGKVEEAVGWATGDREVEARGRVEEATGRPAGDDEVEQAEEEVREDHGDV